MEKKKSWLEAVTAHNKSKESESGSVHLTQDKLGF